MLDFLILNTTGSIYFPELAEKGREVKKMIGRHELQCRMHVNALLQHLGIKNDERTAQLFKVLYRRSLENSEKWKIVFPKFFEYFRAQKTEALLSMVSDADHFEKALDQFEQQFSNDDKKADNRNARSPLVNYSSLAAGQAGSGAPNDTPAPSVLGHRN